MSAVATDMNPELFEEMVVAFADGGTERIVGGALQEVPYADLPEGSKEWYRTRMRAAVTLLEERAAQQAAEPAPA